MFTSKKSFARARRSHRCLPLALSLSYRKPTGRASGPGPAWETAKTAFLSTQSTAFIYLKKFNTIMSSRCLSCFHFWEKSLFCVFLMHLDIASQAAYWITSFQPLSTFLLVSSCKCLRAAQRMPPLPALHPPVREEEGPGLSLRLR